MGSPKGIYEGTPGEILEIPGGSPGAFLEEHLAGVCGGIPVEFLVDLPVGFLKQLAAKFLKKLR